ncbi:hypothetical protein F5Y14DRAFT_430980 [Nemania sp. NC0429]|nr:hypothetical protein F5Y14DRAFT_430980 [Nemania sp. NC0429]
MPFNRFTRCISSSRLAYGEGVGMASTMMGDLGRVCVQGEVLRRDCNDDNLSIFKAEYVLNSMNFLCTL